MKIRDLIAASFIFIGLIATVQADATLYWTGHVPIGGGQLNPPTSNTGYGLADYHDKWATEIIFHEVYDLPGYADASSLLTFCLEWDETLVGGTTFHGVVNTAVIEGSTPDPLDDETAWIYTEYLDGNTFGIADVNQRAAVVQEAIWEIEDELAWTPDYAETAGLISTAEAAVTGGWTNDNVRVLNMTYDDQSPAQDVLILIPEPSTIVMLFIGGLSYLCCIRRFR